MFDSDTAVSMAEGGTAVILVRRETNPDDLHGMVAAHGILTSRGGKTSHAAVVARGMGRTCVCGAESLDVDTHARRFTASDGTVVTEGDTISIDGSTGEVFIGEVAVTPSPVVQYFEGTLDPEGADDTPVVRSVHRLLGVADRVRRLRVRANADNAPDAARARRFGAEGIGLTRTEHMFLGERRAMVETLILAETDAEREEVFEKLLPLQRADFIEIFEAMDGLPVTIRLIDPPLHEFLPHQRDVEQRLADAAEGERAELERTSSSPTSPTSRWRSPSQTPAASTPTATRPSCTRCSGCTRRTRCSACVGSGSAWPSPGSSRCSPARCSRPPQR